MPIPRKKICVCRYMLGGYILGGMYMFVDLKVHVEIVHYNCRKGSNMRPCERFFLVRESNFCLGERFSEHETLRRINMGSRKIRERDDCFIREEWPFADKGIYSRSTPIYPCRYVYIYINKRRDNIGNDEPMNWFFSDATVNMAWHRKIKYRIYSADQGKDASSWGNGVRTRTDNTFLCLPLPGGCSRSLLPVQHVRLRWENLA